MIEQDNIFKKANTVPLQKLFKYYNLNISESNRKCVCPFRSHAKGRESTPSFYFYPETNTFWCFGCKTGVHAVEFVSSYEGCHSFEAASKIIDIFNNDLASYQEKTADVSVSNDLIEFFSKVREIRKTANSIELSVFLENLLEKFDDIYDRYNLHNNPTALLSLIQKTNLKIKDFIIENNICQVQLF